MSLAEMKLEAIHKISNLSNESEIKEILEHLNKFSIEHVIDNKKIDQIFEEASVQYGNTLKKLAE